MNMTQIRTSPRQALVDAKFTWVLENLLEFHTWTDTNGTTHKDPGVQCFAKHGIHNVTNILCLSTIQLESLNYDLDTSIQVISTGDAGKIRSLQAFYQYRCFQADRQVDWRTLTLEEFTNFRLGPYDPDVPIVRFGSDSAEARVTQTSLFQKGIRRDPATYRELKDEITWDSWLRHFRATAHSHKLENILDPQYFPNTQDETTLHQEQQIFLYNVFERVLQTDMGKTLVRQFELGYDAQSIFSGLCTHMNGSVIAQNRKMKLLRFLTDANMASASNCTQHGYLMNWRDILRQYTALVSPALSPEIMKSFLKSAVANVPNLAQLDATEQLNLGLNPNNQPLEFTTYFDMMLVSAATADHAAKESGGRTRRRFHQHESLMDSLDSNVASNPTDVTMHDDPDEVAFQHYCEVNSTARQQTGVYGPTISGSTWKQLSADGQDHWHKMSSADKLVILDFVSWKTSDRAPRNPPARHNGSRQDRGSSRQSARDSTSSQLTAFMHELEPSSFPATGSEPVTTQDPTQVQVGLHSLAPSSAAEASTLLMNLARHSPSSSNRDLPLARPKYHIRTHTTYTVSRHNRSNRGSMIDRGANGGLAGSDCRVISYSDRRVDVVGIDDHEIQQIPIVTAGAVFQTNHGEVIGIMHQYAFFPSGVTIHSSGQLEHYKLDVQDRSALVGGLQRITTPDGYVFPIDFVNGLPYTPMRPYTDTEFDTLPHVFITADTEWDPSVLDNRISDRDNWHLDMDIPITDRARFPFDSTGRYNNRTPGDPFQGSHPMADSLVDPAPLNPLITAWAARMSELTDLNAQDRFPPADDDDSSTGMPGLEDRPDPYASSSDSDDDSDDGSSVSSSRSHVLHMGDLIGPDKLAPTFEAMFLGLTGPLPVPEDFPYWEDYIEEKQRIQCARIMSMAQGCPRVFPHENSNPFLDRKCRPITMWPVFGPSPPRGWLVYPSPALYEWYPAHFRNLSSIECPDEPMSLCGPYPYVKILINLGTDDDIRLWEPPVETYRHLEASGEPDSTQPPNISYHVRRAERHVTQARYDALRPSFLYQSKETLEKTLSSTTQYATTSISGPIIRNKYKSPFPANNVIRRHEPTATDTFFADVPAICCGALMAQFFIGRHSLVRDVFPMKTDKQFVNTLEDVIRKRGAMDKLISDSAQVEISSRVKDILRALVIEDWQSEAYYQHQNFAERGWRDTKTLANLILNLSGANDNEWLLVIQYVCYIQNHTAMESLGWIPPLTYLTGSTVDTSIIFTMPYRTKVYYLRHEASFPKDSTECLAFFVGFSENVGHSATYKLLTCDTHRIIYRSRIRIASKDPNLRVDPPDSSDPPDDDSPTVIKSPLDSDPLSPMTTLLYEDNPSPQPPPKVIQSRLDSDDLPPMPTIEYEDLVGRSYLRQPLESGERLRATILGVEDHRFNNLKGDPDLVELRLKIGDEEFRELVAYNTLMDSISSDTNEETKWNYQEILQHDGPLRTTHPRYKGSTYNVLLAWESGEVTWEPLNRVATDDPVTCALYAQKHGLLDKTGWQRFKKIAKRQKTLMRMANQAKLKSFRTAPVYQYGIRVPRNYKEAVQFDEANGNTKWQDSITLEFSQLDEYSAYKDIGKDARLPTGHQLIKMHLVFAVKHDGRHKARLVAGGHLTATPVESVYSGVVSLRSVRMIAFAAELNGLELWATDIGNAYLEAYTSEKVAFIAGPEFGKLAGHMMIIVKAFYGLKSSGLRWHERLSAVLTDMGFTPCLADPDVWMKHCGDHYEYIGTYVDDLEIASRHPEAILDLLLTKYDFKLKGSGPMTFHLGCDFFRDDDGYLNQSPRKYIDTMVSNYTTMFGCAPKEASSPLEKGDNPELDTSDFLEFEDIKRYQSLIGSMQWAVSLGRLDICTAVMSMSSFRAQPRSGHLTRARRIVGYLLKYKYAAIRYDTARPDFSDLPPSEIGWDRTVYGNVTEALPHNFPPPLGKIVDTTTYVDANLLHDKLTGRSVTGIIHLLNKFVVDFYSKKQATVETSTYGSEFCAAKTATEQILDLRHTLRYMGIPVGHSYLFGDNKSVVCSATIPHSRLNKRHTALSYHRVREAIASGIMKFTHIASELNPSDVLSKHWGHQQIWPVLRPLLFRSWSPSGKPPS